MKNSRLLNGVSFLTLSFFLLFIAAFNTPKKAANNKQQQPATEIKTKDDADLDVIRQRIITDLLQPPVEAEKISQLVKTIKPDGSWPGINYTDTSRTGFQHKDHLENMFELARAYKKQGSPFYGNADVKKTVWSALDFWLQHDFICENWWWNEMGTPNWLINTLLVMDPDITEKQRTEGARIASRASLTGFGARAGGDFVPIAGMVCKQGLFKRNDSILQKAINVMAAQVEITPGRGINPDRGFHHRVDNVTSIHTYGTSYVSSFAYWAVKTAGTKYALPPEALKLLIDYYIDGISKCMAYGIYPDPGAKNRDLSRQGALGAAGTEIPENLMKTSDYRKKDLQYLVSIRKGEQRPTLTWNRYFWHSSYLAHQRKNYYASVRMYSSRQNNTEEPYNEEGLKMHHLADGANFISRTGREYVEIFPVLDWQKIPGTTVVQKPSLPHWRQIAKKGLTDFAGAATDGAWGAAAFDFKSPHDPLQARKAWFFFDREYVCLGAGIRAEGDHSVATTLNQCLLKGDVIAKTKEGAATLKRGRHNLHNISWLMHDSVAYLFPAPASVNVSNTTATGNWRQITHQSWATEEPVQKDVFTLWLNHGPRPNAAGYAYIILPGVSAATADGYSKKPEVTVLSNTTTLQAVHHKTAGITQVVFYEPGTIKINDTITLTTENPCIVMLETKGKEIQKITAADPTHKLKSLPLKVNVPVNASGNGWKATWDKESKISIIRVDLPAEGYAGKSVVLEIGDRKV